MSSQDTISKIEPKTFPSTPGVYLFKDKLSKIIYIGKAGNLARRVSSYFQKNHTDSRITKLVSEVASIDFKTTPTVIEALILEAELIKKYQPKFNIKEKDNKSFLYVVFTREKFSKPTLIRGKELEQNHKLKFKIKNKTIFGPFVNANSIRAALHILRKIFPYSTHDKATSKNRETRIKPCFNYQIGLCPGTCINAISEPDYSKNIRNLILFFRGEKKRILGGFKKQMKQLSKDENFEEAGKLRNQIYALEHIRDTALLSKDRVLPKLDNGAMTQEAGINIFGRIEGYDISNISGTSAVGSMVVFDNGQSEKSEYRKFKIKTVRGSNDVAMLREVLSRRFRYKQPGTKIRTLNFGWQGKLM